MHQATTQDKDPCEYKTRTWTNYKERKKELDRIELVSRAEALIPDDVILTSGGSLDRLRRFWMTPLLVKEDKLG